jgi:hypothetical protein
MNVNRINAAVSVHGDLWRNPETFQPHCKHVQYPGQHISTAGALWLSGYDAGGNLHVAAQTYRNRGIDYWPGPLDASGNLSESVAGDWAKIWRVSREEINTFKGKTRHDAFTTPPSILQWPGKGNVHARGRNGIPLTVTTDMAPFVDLNGDGMYEPFEGEYPDVPGDEAMWWVFSDNGPTHSSTKGLPLKAEVHAMSYAYRRGTLMDYVVYYEYEVVNKSGEDYHDVRMGLWNAGENGMAIYEDYIAFDSVRRMGGIFYQYEKDWSGTGSPDNGIIPRPFATGITIVSMPGDAPWRYVPADSYTFLPVWRGYPTADTQYNHLMRRKNTDGTAFDMPPAGWTECATGRRTENRYTVLSTNDFGLGAGKKAKAVFALVVDTTAKNCPLYTLDTLHMVADTAWQLYHTQVGVPAVGQATAALQVHPNPATHTLHVAGMVGGVTHITVYNVLGQAMGPAVAVRGTEATIDVRHLPAGTYVVAGSGEQGVARAVFVKE